MIDVPAVGTLGGLAIIWNNNLLELYQISTTNQKIHAMIKVNSIEIPSYSCIYASTYRNKSKIL